MSGRTFRWLGCALVATAGAGALALTGVLTAAVAASETPAEPAGSTVGLVMGGSGVPLPEALIPGYMQRVNDLYIDNPLHPNFPGTSYPDPYANGLFTPEYPLLSMPMSINYPTVDGFPALATSMGQGMNIVENAIASNTAAGDASTVFGWSQSSTISGLVMQQLDPTGTPMPNDGLQFVLVGDPSAPNGGLLERFVGLNLPSLGLSFDGATPVNSFPTDIYTLEYDGFADFPKYPINFLADLNAVLGTVTIHGEYLSLSAEQIANATLLPGSAALGTPDSLTNYYMIDQTPPLVTLLSAIPLIGKPLAGLLGPDMTVLINLGYGADNVGYSTPANVPTPFGLFPDVNPGTVMAELAGGAQQGSAAFVSALSHLSLPSLMQALSTALTAAPAAIPPGADIVEGITKAVYSLWTLGYQTGDIINAAVTSLPAYDVSLFLNNLSNPLDALGLPIAADVAGLTMTAGFEVELVSQALSGIIADLTP